MSNATSEFATAMHSPQPILAELTRQQFVHPHQSIERSLLLTASHIGFCRLVSDRSLKRLQIEPHLSIGRLRRTELSQLARSIWRLWRQTADTRQR